MDKDEGGGGELANNCACVVSSKNVVCLLTDDQRFEEHPCQKCSTSSGTSSQQIIKFSIHTFSSIFIVCYIWPAFFILSAAISICRRPPFISHIYIESAVFCFSIHFHLIIVFVLLSSCFSCTDKSMAF